MPTDSPSLAPAQAFITRWRGTTASELSTAQSFVIDLCALLDVPRPHPTPDQSYMFERPVTFQYGDGSSSAGRIDCYRKGAFCLESKKLRANSHSKRFDDGLLLARSQAENYARLEGPPALCAGVRCRYRPVQRAASPARGPRAEPQREADSQRGIGRRAQNPA